MEPRTICDRCGRMIAGRIPKRGDGSSLIPYPHKCERPDAGNLCPHSRRWGWCRSCKQERRKQERRDTAHTKQEG